MDVLPARIELLHPMIVHFPIALLITGALARLLYIYVYKKSWASQLHGIYLWSLFLGFLGLVGAFLSGGEAEDVVNKIICDPTITHDHEDYAQLTLIACAITLFFASIQPLVLSEWFRLRIRSTWKKFIARTESIARYSELLGLTITIVLLVYSSHLGGKLVYEQGAGFLTIPIETCEE